MAGIPKSLSWKTILRAASVRGLNANTFRPSFMNGRRAAVRSGSDSSVQSRLERKLLQYPDEKVLG